MVKESGENFEIASLFAKMEVTEKNEGKKFLKKIVEDLIKQSAKMSISSKWAKIIKANNFKVKNKIHINNVFLRVLYNLNTHVATQGWFDIISNPRLLTFYQKEIECSIKT